MKRILQLSQILWCCLWLAFPCQLRADTIVPSSGSAADVQAAIDSASDGDIIKWPDGNNTNFWSVTVSNDSKALMLDGNGAFLGDDFDDSVRQSGYLQFHITHTNLTQFFVVKNFHFLGPTNGVTHTSARGPISLTATSPKWRICSNYWEKPYGRPYYFITGTNSGGLIDHEYIDGIASSWFQYASANGDNGHGMWATNTYGTTTPTAEDYEAVGWAIYVENCTMSNAVSHNAFCDGAGGMDAVIRCCNLWNVSPENHGRESSGKYRSGLWLGVYSNNFDGDLGSGEHAVLLRGGSGQIAGNTVNGTSYSGLLRVVHYSLTQWYEPYWQATGQGLYDSNTPSGPFETGTFDGADGTSGSFSDSTKSWTPDQWAGYSAVNTYSLDSGTTTASQSAYAVTASSAIFDANMVTRVCWIRWDSGEWNKITGYTDSTHVTVGWSQTVGSGEFTIEAGWAGAINSNTETNLTFLGTQGASYKWYSGDTMAIYQVVDSLDQVGDTAGVLLSGGTDSPPSKPTPVGYPNPVKIPVRYWNNSGTVSGVNDAYYNIMAGRDYTNAAPASWTPVAYPHEYIAASDAQYNDPAVTITVTNSPNPQYVLTGTLVSVGGTSSTTNSTVTVTSPGLTISPDGTTWLTSFTAAEGTTITTFTATDDQSYTAQATHTVIATNAPSGGSAAYNITNATMQVWNITGP